MPEKKENLAKTEVPNVASHAPGSASDPVVPPDEVTKTMGTKKYDGGEIPRNSKNKKKS